MIVKKLVYKIFFSILIINLFLFIIQYFIPPFQFNLLKYPINIYIFLEIIFFLIFSHYFFKNSYFLKILRSKEISIITIFFILFFIFLISIIPQKETTNKIISNFLINNITSSWYFIFTIFLIIISLGYTIISRMKKFDLKNIQFFLLHFGLWIVIAVSFLSYPDKKKLVMQIKENEVVWYAKNQFNQFEEIPFAIKIKKLNANYYFDSIKKIYEPSNYSSEILLFTKSDTIAQDRIISVNNPIYAEGWNIYLNSIDKKNNISTYLIVYDKYYFIIVIGLIMFVLGSILLIYTKLLNFTK